MSTTAPISHLPRMLLRTNRCAQAMPKMVFKGTAIATVSKVILKAWTASGLVIWVKTSPMPSSKVLTSATPIGSSNRTVRYPSAM